MKQRNSIVVSLGKRIIDNKWLYFGLTFTWGLLMTIVGYMLLVILMPFGKVKRFGRVLYLEFNKDNGAGFSVGSVLFVCNSPCNSLLWHEFGHTVHNAIFGPFVLIFVLLPSFIRYWYREFVYYHKNKLPKKPYDDIWFEDTASKLGCYYFMVTMDQTIIS